MTDAIKGKFYIDDLKDSYADTDEDDPVLLSVKGYVEIIERAMDELQQVPSTRLLNPALISMLSLTCILMAMIYEQTDNVDSLIIQAEYALSALQNEINGDGIHDASTLEQIKIAVSKAATGQLDEGNFDDDTSHALRSNLHKRLIRLTRRINDSFKRQENESTETDETYETNNADGAAGTDTNKQHEDLYTRVHYSLDTMTSGLKHVLQVAKNKIKPDSRSSTPVPGKRESTSRFGRHI